VRLTPSSAPLQPLPPRVRPVSELLGEQERAIRAFWEGTLSFTLDSEIKTEQDKKIEPETFDASGEISKLVSELNLDGGPVQTRTADL
jgi:hypothetical protein